MIKSKMSRAKSFKDMSNGFVVDGFDRAIDGIEAEIRPDVEKKYADEWNACGLIKRWVLSRKIEKEIDVLVAEKSKQISADALF